MQVFVGPRGGQFRVVDGLKRYDVPGAVLQERDEALQCFTADSDVDPAALPWYLRLCLYLINVPVALALLGVKFVAAFGFRGIGTLIFFTLCFMALFQAL